MFFDCKAILRTLFVNNLSKPGKFCHFRAIWKSRNFISKTISRWFFEIEIFEIFSQNIFTQKSNICFYLNRANIFLKKTFQGLKYVARRKTHFLIGFDKA